MVDLMSPWNTLSKVIVVNCLNKAGISDWNQQIAKTDVDYPFKELVEGLDRF